MGTYKCILAGNGGGIFGGKRKQRSAEIWKAGLRTNETKSFAFYPSKVVYTLVEVCGRQSLSLLSAKGFHRSLKSPSAIPEFRLDLTAESDV